MHKRVEVKFPKYLKRMVALTKNRDEAIDFKNLMLGAIANEKVFKETSRKNQEKTQSD